MTTPPPGYGVPAPAPQFSVGDAISYAWKKFTANPLPWVLVALLALIVPGVISSIGERATGGWVASIVASVASVLVSYVLQAAMVRGALDEIDGRAPDFGRFFKFPNLAAVLITAILVSIAVFLGLIALIIGAVVVAFLTHWAMPFLLDRNLEPVAAIKASFSVISKNAGPLLLLALANIAIWIIGALLCGIGLLVAFPLVTLSSTYAYRFFTGGYIAPVENNPGAGHPAPGAPGWPQ